MSNTIKSVEILGENIRKVRKELGLSQYQLSQNLNISQRVLCSYEQGTRTMPVAILPQIAKVLNVSTEFLLGIKNETISLDERTRKAKCLRELEKLEKLPIEERKVIFSMIDSLSGKHTAAHA